MAASWNRLTLPGEHLAEPHALVDGLSPLLRVMLYFRTYFRQLNSCQYCDAVQTSHFSKRPTQHENSRYFEPANHSIGGKIGASLSLIFSWANAIRMLTIFTSDDNAFNLQIINKLVAIAVMLQGAIFQTSYYLASSTGQLERLLHQIPVESKLVGRIRKYSLATVVFKVAMTLLITAFFTYAVCFTDGKFDFLLCTSHYF